MKRSKLKPIALAIALAAPAGAAWSATQADEATRDTRAAGEAAARETQAAGNEAMRESREAASTVERGAETAGRNIEQGAEAVGRNIQQGAETAAQTVERGVETAGRRIEQGAHATMQAAGSGAAAAERNFESWSDRARIDQHMNEKQALQNRLESVQARDGYRRALEEAGYRITSINYDTAESVEYEVVKGTDSYEVQLEFDGNQARATSIDVATNIWRADSTRRAMSDTAYMPSTLAYDRTIGPRYRDSRYAQGWIDEKSLLEGMLEPGMRAEQYQQILQQNGYQVTSINDRELDYLEFEIVKADHSYEVQIDRDPGSGLGQTVDVTTNIWQSEATERALGEE